MNPNTSPHPTSDQGPLSGIRVVEICTTIAGPACGRLLADFGADVIKIEPPDGDPVRQMGNHVGTVSLYSASILRGKRSIVAVSIAARRAKGWQTPALFTAESSRP